jgi:hypothetical protein
MVLVISSRSLVYPLLDLVRMHVKLLGQFHQRLLATDRSERHLCLDSRAMVPARSYRYVLFPASNAMTGRHSTFPSCANCPSQLWMSIALSASRADTGFAV